VTEFSQKLQIEFRIVKNFCNARIFEKIRPRRAERLDVSVSQPRTAEPASARYADSISCAVRATNLSTFSILNSSTLSRNCIKLLPENYV
jgi:hypothetical protein